MVSMGPIEFVQFLVFVVPGFVAMAVYDLLVPSARRESGKSMLEVASYSMVNLAITSWLIPWLIRKDVVTERPALFAIGVFFVLAVSPVLLAIGVYRLRTTRFATQWVHHPMPSGWDFFFAKRKPCWVVFHLKNGMSVGGYFGLDSHASSFPVEPEVYVQDVWRMDERGRFAENIAGNAGMVVRYADCSLMEFYRTEESS